MSYDIIVRFPTKEIADYFCRQMSDGFGEGFCDFNGWKKIEGKDGSDISHFEQITSSAPEETPVFFVNWIERF